MHLSTRVTQASMPLIAITLILCLVLTPENVNATLTVIQPSNADSEIEKWEPDNKFGGNPRAYVRSGSLVYVARIIIQFDLSAIPAGARINSAHLRLYYMQCVIGNPSGRTYGAYRLTEGWTETESTWNKRDGVTPWTTAGGVWTAEDFASSIVPPSAEQWMSWDVTGIVKDWIEDGQPNYGFIVRDQNDGVASTDASARFYMREYVTEPALRPVLEIEYVLPTPVGGIVMPTNKLEILAPYVALAGLVAIISMLAVIRRRPKA